MCGNQRGIQEKTSSMIVSIHQPHYLPWAGYFDKIDAADCFVLLDTVQFEKNGWQNRNKIKTSQGWMWLTVPVCHDFGSKIAETAIDNRKKWSRKHMQALVTNYSRAPYFEDYSGYFRSLFDGTWERLAELNAEIIGHICRKIGITTEIVTASSLGEFPEEPNERLAGIVSEVGGDVYLAGVGSKAYLRRELFSGKGIEVVFQDYEPREYPQMFGDFIPGLSVVDVLFNVGEGTLDVIRKGRRTEL